MAETDRRGAPAAARFSVAGRVAFISGASSGLGLHMARLLAAEGARVVLAARRLEAVQAHAQALCGAGAQAAAVALDVTDPASVPAAFDAALQAFDAPPSIVVNNAGVLYFARFLEQDEAQMARVIDTDLKGAFRVAQEAGRRMAAAGGGSLINIASTAGLRAAGGLASYAAAKAGLLHLAQVMALELAPRGVRVNTICPGNFATDMHAAFVDAGVEQGVLKRIPMRRFGRPDDLDGILLLLASDAGAYITGATCTVDGGQTLSWM